MGSGQAPPHPSQVSTSSPFKGSGVWAPSVKDHLVGTRAWVVQAKGQLCSPWGCLAWSSLRRRGRAACVGGRQGVSTPACAPGARSDLSGDSAVGEPIEGAGPAGFNLNTHQVLPMLLSKPSEQLPGSPLLKGGPPAHHLLAQPRGSWWGSDSASGRLGRKAEGPSQHCCVAPGRPLTLSEPPPCQL